MVNFWTPQRSQNTHKILKNQVSGLFCSSFFAEKSLLHEKTALKKFALVLGRKFCGKSEILGFLEKIIFMGQKLKKPQNLEK